MPDANLPSRQCSVARRMLCPVHGGNRVDAGSCGAITEAGRRCGRKTVEYICASAYEAAIDETARLRACMAWVRGMCSDGDPHEEIDSYLGAALNYAVGERA